MNYCLPPYPYAEVCKYNQNNYLQMTTNNLVSNGDGTPTIEELQNKSTALSEIAVANCSISQGAAYDLSSKVNSISWNLYGGEIMNSESLYSKEGFEKINGYYTYSIRLFISIIFLLLLMMSLNISFIPRIVPPIGIGIFSIGTIGMYIDKVMWKEKNKNI